MSRRPVRGLLLACPLTLMLWAVVTGPLAGQAPAERAWNAGDLERAAQLYEQRLEADSTDVLALHRLALIRAWNQQFEESLALFDRLLEIAPDRPTARRDRARVLGWAGHLEQALEELDRVLGRERDDVVALEARAQFRQRAGDLSGALEDYRRLSTLRPADTELDLQRARLLSWQSELEESIALYDSLVAARPEDREARLELARVLSWAGRLDSATAVYRGILERDPDEADAVQGLARVLGWTGDLRASERYWRRAVELSGGEADAWLGLARTLRWEGRPAAALSAWKHARTAAPEGQDVLDEKRWLDARLHAHAGPGFSYEADSDENRIYTLTMDGGFRVVPRLSIGWETYGRRTTNRARPEPDDFERQAAGGMLDAGLQLEPGWWLRAGGGVAYSDGARDDELAAWRASVSSPAHMPFQFILAYRREPLLVTSQLIERGVTVEAVDVRTVWRMGSGWQLTAATSPARFSGTEANDRWTGLLSIDHDVSRSWRLGVTGRAFGFERDLNEGYFDPDLYVLAELNLRWQAFPGDWHLSLELDPGAQKIGEGGDVDGTFRTSGSVGYRFAPGRQLNLSGSFSTTGLQSFSTADADYRYGRVSMGMRWAF